MLKKSHPALSFNKAELRNVRVGGESLQIWMAPDIDTLLNDFIKVGHEDADWNQKRCPFGAVLWPSARALWEWFNEAPARFKSIANKNDGDQLQVIELGSGIGFLSALLASRTQWLITASDYEPAYRDYLEANAKLMGAIKAPSFTVIDWCEPAPEHLRNKFDLVIACDVLYDDSHLDSLPRIACELLSRDGTLLLADPERFRFETAFEKISKRFEKTNRYEKIIANSDDEAQQSGVINPGLKQTKIQIIHCQKPFIVES